MVNKSAWMASHFQSISYGFEIVETELRESIASSIISARTDLSAGAL